MQLFKKFVNDYIMYWTYKNICYGAWIALLFSVSITFTFHIFGSDQLMLIDSITNGVVCGGVGFISWVIFKSIYIFFVCVITTLLGGKDEY